MAICGMLIIQIYGILQNRKQNRKQINGNKKESNVAKELKKPYQY